MMILKMCLYKLNNKAPEKLISGAFASIAAPVHSKSTNSSVIYYVDSPIYRPIQMQTIL